MLLDLILLQDNPEAPAGNPYSMLIMLGGIVVVFYFFMIRPQQKRQKQEAAFRSSLGKGDRVSTIGGIHGRIVSVEEGTALVEVDNGVKIKFDLAALKPVPTESADTKK